jgi:hypothetical protein
MFSSFDYFLYNLSDIVQFGKKEDLLDLWSRDLIDERELKNAKIPQFFSIIFLIMV